MILNRHIIYFISLGIFWGLSASLYKFMGEAGLPVTHIIVYTGLGVGVALGLLTWYRTGSLGLSRRVVLFGLGCGAIMNVPFALSLSFARHVPPAEYAIIVSTAPFFNYFAALLTGRENAASRKLAAVAIGFISSAILVVSRYGMEGGHFTWWTIGAFSVPLIYTLYNWFAAHYWPMNADVLAIGAAESVFSGLLALPFMLLLAPPWGAEIPGFLAYWPMILATFMWIVERIAFFTLIRDKGAVYTIQAVYVATPAAVLWGILFFGGGADIWLWTSLALLMLALWLNNSNRAATA